jgi:hypothetical protein
LGIDAEALGLLCGDARVASRPDVADEAETDAGAGADTDTGTGTAGGRFVLLSMASKPVRCDFDADNGSEAIPDTPLSRRAGELEETAWTRALLGTRRAGVVPGWVVIAATSPGMLARLPADETLAEDEDDEARL